MSERRKKGEAHYAFLFWFWLAVAVICFIYARIYL